MIAIETSINKLRKECINRVYALPYCHEFTDPSGKEHSGHDPESYYFYNEIIKQFTGYSLIPVEYYNRGAFGWNWTGYQISGKNILVITGYYRNVPKNSYPFDQLFEDLKNN